MSTDVRERESAGAQHPGPLTGKSYIVLTDIVYYLIFSAYILFTLHVAPQEEWNNAEGVFASGNRPGLVIAIAVTAIAIVVAAFLIGRGDDAPPPTDSVPSTVAGATTTVAVP